MVVGFEQPPPLPGKTERLPWLASAPFCSISASHRLMRPCMAAPQSPLPGEEHAEPDQIGGRRGDWSACQRKTEVPGNQCCKLQAGKTSAAQCRMGGE